MKTKFLFPILFLLTLTFTFTSCASKEKPPRVRDETFVGDVGPFEIGDIHLYASFGRSRPKICGFYAIFYPRTNEILVKTKIGVDVIQFSFTYNERQEFVAAKDKYIQLYTDGQINKEKPTKKNALSSGSTYINWGMTGPAHQAYAPYYTNIEYILENKPYFRILFEQAKELDDSGDSSPRINIYISPAQWEQICQICDQATLEARVDEILAEADAF